MDSFIVPSPKRNWNDNWKSDTAVEKTKKLLSSIGAEKNLEDKVVHDNALDVVVVDFIWYGLLLIE